MLYSDEKVVNGHYFTYTSCYNPKVKKPAVISFAAGYNWDKIKDFVISLRKSNYFGSLILFIDINSLKTNISLYVIKYNIDTVLIEHNWPFYSELNKKYKITRNDLNECMIPNRNYGRYKWVVYRLPLLYCFLNKYSFLYTHIFYMDCRDIVFQRNPFWWNIDDYLYLVEETDADYCIGVDPSDGKWVKPYNNSNHVVNCRIINSGSIVGKVDIFNKFIYRYNQFLKKEYKITSEQGTLNYMFYTQNWTDIPILINRNGYGFALTLAVDLLYRPDDSFFPHSDMIVYNKDGSIPCFLHQFERKIDKYRNWLKHMC